MKRELEMNQLRSRPRFKVSTKLSPSEFMNHLKTHFEENNKIIGGYVREDGAVFRIREDKNEIWSPQLQVRYEVNEDDPSQTFIKGLFGPRPALWTFFMFMYWIGACAVLFLGMIAFVQMSLGESHWAIYGSFLGVFIIIGTYIAARIGQHWAKENIAVLRKFIEKVVSEV